MYDLVLPQVSFRMVSFFINFTEMWGKAGVLWGCWGFLIRDLEGRVSPDVWMILFYPIKDTLKVLWWYLYWKCVRDGGSRRRVRGGRSLTTDLEDLVIPEAIYDLILPQERYRESFVLISVLEMCQEFGGEGQEGGNLRMSRVPDWNLDDMVIPDVIGDFI